MNATKKRLSTDIILNKGEYSVGSSGVKVKNLDKKNFIDDFIRKVERESYQSGVSLISNATANDVVKVVVQEKISEDFYAFAEDWLSTCKLKGKKNYVCAINNLKKFAPTLSFDDITVSFLRKYESSLSDKPRAQSQYLAVIRHLWKEAEKLLDDDVLPRSPFRKYTPPRQKRVGQRATDIETIRKIYEYQGTGRAMLARDCFILSFCLMGMNAVDLYDCTDLTRNVLKYDRSKVRDRREDKGHTEINVHKFIKPIIKKYKGRGTHVFKFSSMYYQVDAFNKALNKGLKRILGENTPVTFYSARHSWASIARNDLEIEKATVNDALVHIDEAMDVTDMYIKKDYRLINNANKKVIEYVFAPYL